MRIFSRYTRIVLKRIVLAAFAPILGIVLSFSAASAAGSKELAPSPFGGHVHALAVHPKTGDLYLGARPIYRSTDSGRTWSKIGKIPKSKERANITAIKIDVKNPQTMYATGHGIGVAKSIDGGTTWKTKAKGLPGTSTEALAIDARNSNRLYVWVLSDGLYRSDDAAESWQRVDDGPKQQEIRNLVSLNNLTGMGGIWLYAGLDVGILKSPDCFCGWDRLQNNGLPDKRRVYSLAADPQNPSTLYAGLRQGVFKTTDNGKNWRLVMSDISDAIVAVHPKRTNIIYASSDDGKLHRSEDGGKSWRRMN